MACGCVTYQISGSCQCGDCPISVRLPIQGNGTLANPIYIDFDRLEPAELQTIANGLCGDATAAATLAACVMAAGETLTSLAFNANTFTLTYTDEQGNATAVDLTPVRPSHTAGAAPPGGALLGDTYYDTGLGALFKYVNDGVSNLWLQIS